MHIAKRFVPLWFGLEVANCVSRIACINSPPIIVVTLYTEKNVFCFECVFTRAPMMTLSFPVIIVSLVQIKIH